MHKLPKQKKLALAVLLASQALAATAVGQEAENGEIDEIVVTGTKQQLRSGIEAKNQALGVADFISADEFGKQADINLADSLRRLPGVTTEFDEDEGRFVSVRGLPSRYTTVTLNGSLVPDSWHSMMRDQNVEALPSFAIKRSGVYKSLTADMEGNAIGGYIDNTLVSAFDRDGRYLSTDFRIGSHSYQETPGGDGDPSYRGQFLFSDQFGENDQWGLMVAGYYFEKSRDQTKAITYKQNRDDVERGWRVHQFAGYDYSNTLTRWSGLARLEYRNDRMWSALSYGKFDYQYDEILRNTVIYGRGAHTETETGGTWEQGMAQMSLQGYPIHTETDTLLWDMEYDFDNGGRLTLGASRNEGLYELYEMASSVDFRSGNLDQLGFSYDLSAQREGNDPRVPDFDINDPSVLQDGSLFEFYGDFWPRAEESGQEISQFKVDYDWGMDDMGFGFKVGALWRELSAWQDFNRADFYSPADPASFPTADHFIKTTGYNPGLGMRAGLIDRDKFLDYFYANPEAFDNDIEKGLFDITKNDLSYDEEIKAAYGLVKYRGDNFRVVAGVRYEQTDWDSVGVINNYPESGMNTFVDRDGSYDNVLPSIVGYYNLTDTMKLRFGYNKSIGRPDPQDLAARESINENDDGDIRVSRGNPNLKPREADNFDIALELNLGEGEFFSIGYFYKDLENEIFTMRNISTGVNSFGDPAEVITTEPINLSDTSVQGVEITFINDAFDSLPAPFNGLGFSSNLTYLKADLDVPMDVDDPSVTRNIDLLNGSAKWKANASLMYELGNFDSRLTYAYRGDTRRSTSTSTPLDDSFEAAYSQWDLHLGYRLNNGTQLYIEGRNITNAARLREFASGLHSERNEFGRSWWVGASHRF